MVAFGKNTKSVKYEINPTRFTACAFTLKTWHLALELKKSKCEYHHKWGPKKSVKYEINLTRFTACAFTLKTWHLALEIKKSKCEYHHKWGPKASCLMMRGFQTWPQNSK